MEDEDGARRASGDGSIGRVKEKPAKVVVKGDRQVIEGAGSRKIKTGTSGEGTNMQIRF